MLCNYTAGAQEKGNNLLGVHKYYSAVWFYEYTWCIMKGEYGDVQAFL